MRKEQVKTGVLSVILLGSIVQISSCAAKKREQAEMVDDSPVESVETTDILSKPVEIQIDGEVIGTLYQTILIFLVRQLTLMSLEPLIIKKEQPIRMLTFVRGRVLNMIL